MNIEAIEGMLYPAESSSPDTSAVKRPPRQTAAAPDAPQPAQNEPANKSKPPKVKNLKLITNNNEMLDKQQDESQKNEKKETEKEAEEAEIPKK